MGGPTYGAMGPPRQQAAMPQHKAPRAHVLAADQARGIVNDRAGAQRKALEDKRGGGGDVGALLGWGGGGGGVGSGTLTRDQLPAALAVASTLHAKGRHAEAERVLSRVMVGLYKLNPTIEPIK
jgi:hypothetical protein